MLGALSCNALLGIGEASLRCDTDPCPADAPGSETPLATVDADPATVPMGPAPSGAEAPARDDVIAGNPPLQSPPGAASGDPAADEGAASGGSSAPANGASGSGSAGASGAGGGSSAGMAPPDAGSEPPPIACDRDDACGVCLCAACREEFAECERTQGCIEIVACARINGCSGIDCYCGSVGAIACGNDRGNGPCFEVTRAAPGFRVPTLGNPSAGPASNAALTFGSCVAQNGLCAQACSN